MDYSFLRRDQLRKGTKKVEDSLSQKTETHLLGAFADYGISNKVSLSASIPLVFNRSVNRNLDESETNFGNLTVLGRLFLNPRVWNKPTNMQLAVGGTLPLGRGVANVVTDKRNFASGTVDPVVQAVIAIGITPGFNVNATFFTRQIIETSSDGQEVGDVFQYTVGGTYAPVGGSYSATASFKYIDRGQDKIDGVPFPSSGGQWWYFVPGFSKTVWGAGESAIRLWSQFEFPFYQSVNGFQLTEDWSIRFGVDFGLTLFGHQKKDEHDLPLTF